MRRYPLTIVVACVMATAGTCSAQGAKIMLSTGRPGSLFGAGTAVSVLAQAEPALDCKWTLTDYDGKQVVSGTCQATAKGAVIELGELPRGYYELACQAADTASALSLGVVTDRSADAPPSTRLNVDGAVSWLSGKDQFEDLAKVLRTIGMGWVRERFAWGGTEPSPGEVNWQQYDASADAFFSQGVRVYQIWHDAPGWTHPGDNNTRNPQDLRDVYRFTKRVAEHYKGRVAAWEVWNEPDIGFWPDLGDTFAGLQKAAYLGFKAGDPDLPVLQGSFCRGYCAFDESLFESGLAEYFDIFNWHIYAPPAAYRGVLSRYLELLERYKCADRPVWLSEAGIRLEADEPDGELSADLERLQAEFVPKSFASSLAAGVDRHFFFVYPFYLENGVQFGALHKDLSPRPGFVAIAAALDALGDARYLGKYEVGTDKVTILAFDSGEGVVLVAWADEGASVDLDLGTDGFTLSDEIGRRTPATSPGGKYTAELTSAPVYLMGLGDAVKEHLTGEVRPEGKLPRNAPSPVVVRGQAKTAQLDKTDNCYLIDKDAFDYQVEVCNLSETTAAAGKVALELPEGWVAEPASFEAGLEPMGRVVQMVRVTPGKPAGQLMKLRVVPTFEGTNAQPSMSYFRFDPTRLTPTASKDLELNEPGKWRSNISGNGSMETTAGAEGGVHFEVKFTGPGDRWCYPMVPFDPPADFSQYDGISFDFRCAPEDKMSVRLQVTESPASNYLNEACQGSSEWRTVSCMFRNMGWGSFSPPDANGKLDTDAIRNLLIGLNTGEDAVWLEVRNVQLVRYW